jgi:serine/threonine protein kinase
MKKWDNNKFIKKYLINRSNSEYKIVLFMEYIPYVAGDYMEENPSFIKNYYEQATKIIKFLNSQKILYNDVYLFNYLVDDNKNLYLTDFGLSLDTSFNLTKNEINFMKKNKKK